MLQTRRMETLGDRDGGIVWEAERKHNTFKKGELLSRWEGRKTEFF